MRKVSAAIALVAIFLTAGIAQAATVKVSLTETPSGPQVYEAGHARGWTLALAAAIGLTPHGAFTLNQARGVDIRYEHSIAGHVGVCRWRNRHDAECDVTLAVRVIDGGVLEHYAWKDEVTRSGPCSNPGRIVKRVHGLTYQDGGHHVGNCFTGPLVAVPIENSITQSA